MGLRGSRNFSQFWPIVAGPIVAALIPVAATAQSTPVVRQASTPVIARIVDDQVTLDPRTVPEDSDALVVSAVVSAAG